MTQHTSPDLTARFPVSDRAVRSFRWYLPIAIGVMWWSGEQGRNDIHEKVGYELCLLATLIIWGFIGIEAATFRAFLFAPRTVLNYLRVGGQYVGYNPPGWSVSYSVAAAVPSASWVRDLQSG